MRCFVPNCENTEGVPFPEDQDLKNVWIKSLNNPEVLPEEHSFVCLDHFEKNDIEDILNEENVLVARKVKSTAVPKVLPIDPDVDGGATLQFTQSLESPQNDSESSNFYIPTNDESSTQSDALEVQQTSSNDDLEASNHNIDINQEQVEMSSEQNEGDISSVQQIIEDLNDSEETGQEVNQILPNVSESLHDDVVIDKQAQLESLLDTHSMKTNADKETDLSETQNVDFNKSNLMMNTEFPSVGSNFQSQDAGADGGSTEHGGEAVQIYAPGQEVVFTSENETMFVTEGQNLFTTAGGQHVYVPEGQTLLTTEGQQVFVTEGQTVFTTNGQQVFVTAGQTLLTEDGQQVFLEGDEQSFNEQDTFLNTGDNFQNNSGANDGTMSSQQDSQDAIRNDSTEDELELLKQAIGEKQIDKTASNDLPQENAVQSRHLVINDQQQIIMESYGHKMEHSESVEAGNVSRDQEDVQPAATLVVKTEMDSSESSRDIVMQWFVPPGSNAPPGPLNSFSGVLGQGGTVSTNVISQQRPQSSGRMQQYPSYKKNLEKFGPSTSNNPPVVNADADETCRLCGLAQSKFINILDNIRNNIMILEAIQLCIHPLEVSLEDPFSKKVCIDCFTNLQKYYEFRQKCLEMNLTQRRLYEKAHPNYKFPEKNKFMSDLSKRSHMRTVIHPGGESYHEQEILTVTKGKGNQGKNVTRKIIVTPTSFLQKENKTKRDLGGNVLSRTNSNDNLQVFKGTARSRSRIVTKSGPRAVIPIVSPKKFSAGQLEAIAKRPLSHEKQLKVQEELKKVIEGKMSKEQLSMDQVIVRVVSDDETDDTDYIPQKRRRVSVVNTSVTKTGHSKMKIGRNEVVIPKGIRVTIPDRFESSIGVFPCIKKLGAFDTEFSLIDGYLFEHRLCKGKQRFLKCLSPNCPSKAVQKKLSPDYFESKAEVIKAHTHHPLTSTEIKKQMFYYIMKKKMQADKGLNFRNIYDEICNKDEEIAILVPLRSLINEICKHQLTQKVPPVNSFDDFYNIIEDDALQKFQFTYSGAQFYQERFIVEEEGTKAVVFANVDTIKKVSDSILMYVDASFRIDSSENFNYQLVTVLVWIDDSYYPIMFALVSNRTMEIFKKIFGYLHDTLAPKLRPEEIVTDYEANIYYALGETYLDSHIGGSVFYYTQNLYKKICELGLSKELETTSYFRNIYHMLLMLPLLPVNTIPDGLQNIEIQAYDLGISSNVEGLIEHIKEQWMDKVTPDLFCVHRLENRINENVIAPFKKLRDFLMLNKGKSQRQSLTLMNVVEKLIELENFLQTTYSSENKKSFGRDLSSSQKKNVLKAWHYIESHPKININHFFTKVIGYIRCMENQLWIWGYYKFSGKVTDDLINAANFSIVNTNDPAPDSKEGILAEQPEESLPDDSENTLVMDAVVGPTGEFVLSNPNTNQESDSSLFKYVH